MATCERRVVTTTVVEFVVPAPWPQGACWVELYKAVSMAHQELIETGRLEQGEDAPDDMIRMVPGDGQIIVRFHPR